MKRIEINTNEDVRLFLQTVKTEVNGNPQQDEIGIELCDEEKGICLFTSMTKKQAKYLAYKILNLTKDKDSKL